MKLDTDDTYAVRCYDIPPTALKVGQEFYLTETTNTNNGDTWREILLQPGRTNMSHEKRINGFLGSTNNLSKDAIGQWRITKINGSVITAERVE